MKLFILCLLTLTLPLAAATGETNTAPAAAPSNNSAKPSTDKTASSANTPTAAAPTAPPLLEAYLSTLTDRLALSKDEQTDIKTYYFDDGVALKNILNDATLSPLQQMRQVEDLRDKRNTKILALLREVNRQHTFLVTETAYRVALTELAANGGLVPSTPPPRVPQPTALAPGQTEKVPNPKSAP